MNRFNQHEMSPLSKRELPATGGIIEENDYSFWILPNPVGQAQSVPLQGLRQDLLPEQRDGLLSTPASARYVR